MALFAHSRVLPLLIYLRDLLFKCGDDELHCLVEREWDGCASCTEMPSTAESHANLRDIKGSLAAQTDTSFLGMAKVFEKCCDLHSFDITQQSRTMVIHIGR